MKIDVLTVTVTPRCAQCDHPLDEQANPEVYTVDFLSLGARHLYVKPCLNCLVTH